MERRFFEIPFGTVLPHDVFYSHIIPDVLSDHLHRVLVHSETPAWHAFYVLPLVSTDWRATCHKLCEKIFGLEPGEGGKTILDILDYAKTLWNHANSPRPLPVALDYTYGELMSSHSLIQVYMCAALAKSYLNLDVLYHLDLEQRRDAGEFSDDEEEDTDAEDTPGLNPTGYRPRRFKMRDDNMHRVFLPLTCAMKICDRVKPARVAYIAADYLAEIVPLYSTAPVMLKYTQDLESYITRKHRLEMETWITWTYQTLNLVQQIGRLLRQMQDMGNLVKSFKRNSEIPLRVIKDTKILQVLGEVAIADWGLDTEEITERAFQIRDELAQDLALSDGWGPY